MVSKDIRVIIPVHTYNDGVKELLERAINSVPKEMGVTVITKNNLSMDGFNWDDKKNVRVVNSESESGNFCELINEAVKGCDTDWFSILEFDDEYTDIWFKNVLLEMKNKPDVSVFLPLEDLMDYEKNMFVGYGNEAPWASSFSNDVGFIDNDCLQEFFDFYLTGSVFNKQDFINQGGLKASMKVSFWYEFMLRLTNADKKFYVVPKLGYKHYVGRPESLFEGYKKDISNEENDWWFELAKKEYLFKKDRNKIYQKEEEETTDEQ